MGRSSPLSNTVVKAVLITVVVLVFYRLFGIFSLDKQLRCQFASIGDATKSIKESSSSLIAKTDETQTNKSSSSPSLSWDEIQTKWNKEKIPQKKERQCPPLEEFVKCRLKEGERKGDGKTKEGGRLSIKCNQCTDEPWGRSTYSAYSIPPPPKEKKTIYLPVLVPPDYGSTMLVSVLSTSPAVSDMCKKSPELGKVPWMCEATKILTHHNLFEYEDRFNPNANNWTKVYEIYHRKSTNTLWRDPTKPILMDKAPCNIAKTKSLMEFFHDNDMDYRAIVMWRHPCRKNWLYPEDWEENHNPRAHYGQYMEEIMKYVPPEKRFHIDYDELLLRPKMVLPKLLKWFPQLESLTVGKPEKILDTGRSFRKGRKRKKKGGVGADVKAQRQLTTTKTNEVTVTGTNSSLIQEKQLLHPSLPSLRQERQGRQRPARRSLLGMHASSLQAYVHGTSCKLSYNRDVVTEQELEIWDRFVEHAHAES